MPLERLFCHADCHSHGICVGTVEEYLDENPVLVLRCAAVSSFPGNDAATVYPAGFRRASGYPLGDTAAGDGFPAADSDSVDGKSACAVGV